MPCAAGVVRDGTHLGSGSFSGAVARKAWLDWAEGRIRGKKDLEIMGKGQGANWSQRRDFIIATVLTSQNDPTLKRKLMMQ